MKIIIDLPDYFKDKLSKRDYNALEKVYIKQAISKGIILMNATNGDIFNAIVDVDNDCVDVHGENGYMTFVCTQEWWDSPYKDSEKNTAKTTTLKKPAVVAYYDYISHECNTCHGRFICNNPKYCPCCGRLII